MRIDGLTSLVCSISNLFNNAKDHFNYLLPGVLWLFKVLRVRNILSKLFRAYGGRVRERWLKQLLRHIREQWKGGSMHGVVNFTQNNSKPKKGSFVVKEAHGREDFEKLINDMEKKGFDLDSWNMTPAVRETLAGPVQTILFFGVFSISLYVGEWNPGPEDANANTHLLG